MLDLSPYSPAVMTRFLVEVYAPKSEDLVEAVARAREATEGMRLGGLPIHHVEAILVPADELSFHLFEASSAEVVQEASQRAGLLHARIVEAVQ
jgi:hypothetical protein